MAQAPVRRFTMWVLVCPNLAAAAHTSGCFSLIHRMEQSEEPPETGRLHVSRRNFSSPTALRMARACRGSGRRRTGWRGPERLPSSAMGSRPGVVTENDTTPTAFRNGGHLAAAFRERLPPQGRVDIGPAAAVDVDVVAAGGFAALLQLRAEDAQFQRRGAHIHGQNIAAHSRPSSTRNTRNASTCSTLKGSSGRRGMPPWNPARVMAALTPEGP